MKRSMIAALVLSLVLTVLLPAAALADSLRVAVVQPLTHTSLNQIRDTIISELQNSGIEFEIIARNAEGDSSALSTILENGVALDVDPLLGQLLRALRDGKSLRHLFTEDFTEIYHTGQEVKQRASIQMERQKGEDDHEYQRNQQRHPGRERSGEPRGA